MRLAVSACLLGQRVRYDGGHKLLPFLEDGWAGATGLVELLPLCPEAQAGLPIPREPVALFSSQPSNATTSLNPLNTPVPQLKALGLDTGDDYTAEFQQGADRVLSNLELDHHDFLGFLLKSGSPSCGKKIQVTPLPSSSAEHPEEPAAASGLLVQAIESRNLIYPVADELSFRTHASRQRFLFLAFAHRRKRLAVADGTGVWDEYWSQFTHMLTAPQESVSPPEDFTAHLEEREVALVEASARFGDAK